MYPCHCLDPVQARDKDILRLHVLYTLELEGKDTQVC